MGDPRGHWEGNTLAIETTNLLGERNGVAGNGGLTYSNALPPAGRFTRVDEDTINEAVIDDPKIWTKPWKIAFSRTRNPGYEMVEYACPEGNYALRDILSGAAADRSCGKNREITVALKADRWS
jgi:hypothetical protein